MAKSFADSLNALQTAQTSTMSLRSASTLAAEEETWTLNTAYDTTDNYALGKRYEDENISYVDDRKTVKVNDFQVNLTQEENSQYIPFEMGRYYDGIDLMTDGMKITFYFENIEGGWGEREAINVRYTDTKIRLGFLVPKEATLVAGKLKFEIHVTGSDPFGGRYVWKTKPNEDITIIESLQGNGDYIIDPGFAENVLDEVKQAASDAQYASSQAKAYSDNAQTLNTQTTAVVNEALAEMDTKIADVEVTIRNDVITELSAAYYTIDQTDSAIASAIQPLSTDISSLDNRVTKNEGDILDLQTNVEDNYYKKTETLSTEEIEQKIADIDVTTQLTTLEEKIASEYYNIGEIDEKLENIDVSDELANYYTKTETYSKEEIDSAINVQNNRIDVVEAQVNTIGSLVSDVTENDNGIEVHYNNGDSKVVNTKDTTLKVEDINKSESGLSVVYTDGSTKEIEISGGSGTAPSGSASITRITPSSVQCRYGDECLIDFEFTALDSAGDVAGDGTATWYVGSIKKATSTVIQGTNSFDISKYLAVGSNNVKVVVNVDTGGENQTTVSKTWTVNTVNLYLDWNYDDTTINESDAFVIRWTPYGNLAKTTHIVIDGTEVATSETTRSGVEQYVTMDKLSHGSHTVELYLSATINDTETGTIYSESVYHDMIFVDSDNTETVIACSLAMTVMTQYNTLRIPIVIYNPTSLTSDAILAVDGEQVDEWTDVGRTIKYWNYTPSDYGEKTLTIISGNTIKTLTITVEQLDIKNEEIQGYAFRLKASDFAGNEALRAWNSNGVTLSFSDNFDWNNGGIQTELDENGNIRQYVCVKAGTTATIDYLLFANDAKVNGKSFKVIFKATNSRDHDAMFLSCMNNGIGIELGANGGSARSGQNTLDVQYCEESYVEFEYDISPAPTETSTNTYRYIQTYLDGVLTSTNIYASDDQFKQSEAQQIVIGSPDCDVYIYMVKAYESYLSRDNHIENFIADAPNAQEMVARYERNDILNDSGEISYEKLAKKNPNARVHLWSIPRMTEGKKDYVTGCSYQQIYSAGDARHQLTANNVTINIQGTSSVDYKDSGANTDGNFTEGFTDGNGNHIDTYSMSDNSIGVNYFNTKVNIASCENINNMCLAEWYNRYQPYTTLYRLKNENARDCMEHHIGVQFIHDQSHTLFSDDNYHMYAICNMGNSKNNSAVFHDLDNPLECCIETKDNNSTHCMMLDPNFTVDDLDSEDYFEFRYPDSPTDDMKNAFVELVRWFANGNPANATNEALDSEVTFEPYTFSGTGQENEVLAGLTISDYAGTYTHDTYEYRMAKMLSECEDHLIMDSMVYHYVFIEQHAMVDNVCKNIFWGTEDLVHWHLAKNYDNDTGDGNSNTGKLIIPFGSEGYDDLDGSPIFNGRDNVYWRFIYGLYEARRVMWTNRETVGAWNAEAYLTFARERQNYLPERVYNQDYWYKYLRLYEQKEVTTYIPMLEGGKKNHQRESFVTNNLYYMASQYMGTACTSKSITLRGYTPSEWAGVEPKAQVTVMLYNKGYIVVQIASIFKRVKAEKGVFYTIEFPESGNMNDTVINIHGANLVQAVGDISCLYTGRSDYSAATKIRSIQIGSTAEGYQNNNLTQVGFGTNKMLEELYIQNCPNIRSTLDLSGCQALLKLDIRGSGFTGVTFAVGGLIENALLCSPASLNMRSLYSLTDNNFSLENYDNLTQIRLEDCKNFNSLALVNNAVNLNIARILGINWNLSDTTVLDRVYELDGLNENNIAVDQSVVSGYVYVPVIRQKQYENYLAVWPDLTVDYPEGGFIEQYPVTFKNEDGAVLCVQYVDKGSMPTDPIANGTISTPTKERTVSHNFTYAGWDASFTNAYSSQTYTATYTSSIRQYTVKFMSKGIQQGETITADYGTTVFYEGDIPTYTGQETAYTYSLFTNWDKSGYVDGDKVINAVFDTCTYTDGYFDGKELSDLRPVEIYMLTKMNLHKSIVEPMDSFSFTMGNDCDYGDIESTVLISEPRTFTGADGDYYDTGYSIIDSDQSFVIAVDYEFASDCSSNGTLMQCFYTQEDDGFKLYYNSNPYLQWKTSSVQVASTTNREMLVIRHIAGEPGLHYYTSNLTGTSVVYGELAANTFTARNSTIVFGARKYDNGTTFDRYAKGIIHWAKVWKTDLGDATCRDLAAYIHEEINTQMCGFDRHYLSDGSGNTSSMSFLGSHAISMKKPINTTSVSTGGWATSALKTWLNSRFYAGLPLHMKQLIKEVRVKGSVGEKSYDVATSNDYIYIPSAYALDDNFNRSPYSSEEDVDTVTYMESDADRMLTNAAGTATDYWTRSPFADNTATSSTATHYWYKVGTTGALTGYNTPSSTIGVVIQFSI